MYASDRANAGGGGNESCRRHLAFWWKGAAISVAVASLTVAGCHDERRAVAGEPPAIDVNGLSLTESEVDREIAFRLALVKFRKPKMAGAALENVQRRIAASVTNEIISGLLFQSAAARRGVCADEAATNAVLARYRRTFAPGKDGLAKLERRLAQDGLAGVFTNCLARDLAREAYLAAFHGDELDVREKDVDALLKRIRRFNETAAATNALAYAKATNLWRRVQSGADFAKLADVESEDPDREPGGEIGECEKVDFDGIPGYWDVVSKLGTGEVSSVLRTDVALELVKALTPLAPSENTGEPARRLARIYIRLPAFHPEWARDDARRELAQEARREVLQKAFAEVCAGSTVRINGETQNLQGTSGQSHTGSPVGQGNRKKEKEQ